METAGWEKSVVEGKYLKYEDYWDRKNRLSDLCKYSDPEKKNKIHRHSCQLTKKLRKIKAFCFHSPHQLAFDFEQISVTTSSTFLIGWVGYDTYNRSPSIPLFLSIPNFTTYSHLQLLNMCLFFLPEKSWYCLVFLGFNKQMTWHSCLKNNYLSKFQKIYFVTMSSLNLSPLFSCREHSREHRYEIDIVTPKG